MENIEAETGIDKEAFNIFYEKARKQIFGNHVPTYTYNRRPIAILTGGQPGAGKSGIVIKSCLDFNEIAINPVILDGDLYRGCYPNSKKLATEEPEQYTDITDKATGKVMGLLIKESILKGFDFIREGTLNSAEIVDQLINSPKNYKIIIRLMATCREESILSCFERYILMKETIGMGRFVTIQSHDKRYKNFPHTAREQEKKGVQIQVFERGDITNDPILLYDNKTDKNRFNGFEEALYFGRKQSYEKCKKDINKRIFQIEKELKIMPTNEEGILEQLEQFKREIKVKKEKEMEER